MTKALRHVAIGFFILLSSTPTRAFESSEQETTIIVKIDNLSALNEAVIRDAQSTAAAFYSEIGLSLVWLQTSEQLPPSRYSAVVLRVAFLSSERTQLFLHALKVPQSVLGIATRDGAAVYLFCDRIEAVALKAARPFHVILGRVLAHEIGHQLLPGKGHSNAGIMQKQVEMAPIIRGFTKRQRDSIRAMLAKVEQIRMR